MNESLENLSPRKKRHWLLQQLEKNEKGHFHNIRAIEGQNLNNIDLSDLDFVGLKVGSCLSFRNCQLQQANFSGCTLQDVYFEGANLEAANFSKAHLIRCDFSGSLRNINFSQSCLTDIGMKSCYLSYANFEKAQINGTFEPSNLVYSNFKEAILYGVDFNDVNLQNSCFYSATFQSPEVSRQHKIYRYSFRNACLNNSDFRKAMFRVSVSFARAKLQKTNFSEVDFTQNYLSFFAADLTDALMPVGWLKQISKDKIDLATLPNGTFYQQNKSKKSSLFGKNTTLIKKLINFVLWFVSLCLYLLILTGLLWLVYQGGTSGFLVAPIVSLFFAIIGYNAAQSQIKSAWSKAWDYSPLLFGLPIIVSVLAIPFILLGIFLGNIPLLAVLFNGIFFAIPVIYFLNFH
ncbi:MAG: pentapeptide repeat-containing protein [Spirulina sp.]